MSTQSEGNGGLPQLLRAWRQQVVVLSPSAADHLHQTSTHNSLEGREKVAEGRRRYLHARELWRGTFSGRMLTCYSSPRLCLPWYGPWMILLTSKTTLKNPVLFQPLGLRNVQNLCFPYAYPLCTHIKP